MGIIFYNKLGLEEARLIKNTPDGEITVDIEQLKADVKNEVRAELESKINELDTDLNALLGVTE